MDSAGELDALVSVMPAPAVPLDPGRSDGWPWIERQVGLRLPSDYKAFIAAYGSGRVAEFLGVFNPFSDNPHVRLPVAAEANHKIYREIRTFEHIPFPIHPEPGGLFSWGQTDNGDVMFWVTDPPDEPDRWAIAISEVRGPGWFRHPGPLVRFLHEWLTGDAIVPFLPDDLEPVFARDIPWPEMQARAAADRTKWQATAAIPPAFSMPGPSSPGWPPTTTDAWIDALRTGDGMARTQAAEHLATLGEPILPTLIGLLEDEYPTIWIVRAILGVGKAAVPALLDVANRRNGRLDWFLAQALGGTADERALGPLVAGLTADDDATRENAAIGLGVLGRREARTALIAALADSDDGVRREAVAALAAIAEPGDEEAASAATGLLGDPEDRVRAAAARAVGRLGGPSSVELLGPFLADRVAEVRLAATDGLGGTGSPAAATILLERLPTLNPRLPVREELAATISALGRLRDPRAREPLEAILLADHRDWQPAAGGTTFASLAEAALAAIDGRDEPPLAPPL
jgi:HEAT repeat protein